MALAFTQNLTRHKLLVLAILLFLGSYIFDFLVDPGFRSNPTPQFGLIFVVRSLILVISAKLLLDYILQYRRPQAANLAAANPRLLQFSQVVGLVLGAGFLGVFLIDPILFVRGSSEDGPVEWLSALGLLLASGLFLIVAVKMAIVESSRKKLLIALTLLMAAGFFVIGMEEISWFQRVLDVPTPDFFSANSQGEMNLHNFDSGTSEEIYYFGSFFLLILLPFIADQSRLLDRFKQFDLILPSTTVLFASALLAAYNYNLWNRTSIQFAFFMTLWILGYYALQAIRNASPSRYVLIPLFVLYAATQIAFLVNGHTLIIEWAVTEYRELLMPFGFVVYAAEVAYRSLIAIAPAAAAGLEPVRARKT